MCSIENAIVPRGEFLHLKDNILNQCFAKGILNNINLEKCSMKNK